MSSGLSGNVFSILGYTNQSTLERVRWMVRIETESFNSALSLEAERLPMDASRTSRRVSRAVKVGGGLGA
ncbi:hypothetical protein DVH05_027970 [Phytophthora capsici]|nr:hypothetical protein DVH05_027970 [Phytophthora capsici]